MLKRGRDRWSRCAGGFRTRGTGSVPGRSGGQDRAEGHGRRELAGRAGIEQAETAQARPRLRRIVDRPASVAPWHPAKWKACTVRIMRQRKNLSAVALVADKLLVHTRLGGS